MTQRWAFAGELGPNDALDWGGTWSGNVPKSILPDLGSDAFWVIMRLAADGPFEGKQIDWGAWALRLNGPQLRDVLTRIYGADLSPARTAPYAALADELGENKFIALVAAEL